MSLESKRWTFSRLILAVVVGFTVFSYVSYIAYEFSRSVTTSGQAFYHEKIQPVRKSDTRSPYRNLNHEPDRNSGPQNSDQSKIQTSQSNPGNNLTNKFVKPCSRNSGPCKDIPDYFKGLIHNYKNNFLIISIKLYSNQIKKITYGAL